MIIPSIDIMDGRAVQLRQGKELVLVSERSPMDLVREYNRYGVVAVVDLDAALGRGDNQKLIQEMCRVAEVRVGGGIRDENVARDFLRAGASKLVICTAAVPEFLSKFPKEKIIVALDHKGGEVVDHGWTNITSESVAERGKRLAPFCGEFLCTFVKGEGMLEGVPVEEVVSIAQELEGCTITIAGGVRDTDEAFSLSRLGVNVQVGMSLYTGKLDLAEAVVKTINFDTMFLVPTVVQDESGQVLMLAYSSQKSLLRSLGEGKGIYFSRSRNEIWEKGATSGNTQELISCRYDCDNDALLFVVRQQGVACHTGWYSCFGSQNKRFSLRQLFEIIKQRIEENCADSYTVRLANDDDFLRKKVMEEASEVVGALTMEDLRWETADLLYHSVVLAVKHGLEWQDIEHELSAREGQERRTL